MNISKYEQRVLHALAQGGAIFHERSKNGKVHKITCFTRDGHILSDCTFEIFQRLKKRRFIQSRNGQPYRASRLGITSARSQLNNR
ncbi:YjhX family toxin [Sneathiella marina]|uniref:YjhX family toxin n=1 Tax=Sneathiella marina TaxID=2950108 RepID=UPI003B8461CB